MRFSFLQNVFLIMLCSVLASYSIAFAETTESIDSIKAKAKDFLARNVPLENEESLDIKIHSTDDTPKQMSCSREIEINLPKEVNIERVSSLEIVCNGDRYWHTFLPVQVDKFTNVVVAKRVILTNEIISESDLDFAKSNVNRLYSGFYKNKSEVTGQMALHTIDAGGVFTKKNIHAPQLVHRNQIIDLIARKNSIQVVMQGVSKSDGCLNETITAYNPSSKKTLQAVVVDYNKAEVIS